MPDRQSPSTCQEFKLPTFERPLQQASSRDKFGYSEVGITHPTNSAYIKLCDTGSIELMADEGLGIIIDTHTRSISLHADSIKLFTRDNDGIRWNKLSLNPRATKYVEPAFIEYKLEDVQGLFNGLEDVL